MREKYEAMARARPAPPVFLLYHDLRTLSTVNSHKFKGLLILKFMHFFCIMCIDIV